MPNFIMGQSQLPTEGVIHTLRIDIPGGTIHEYKPETEILYATKDGVESVYPLFSQRFYTLTLVEEPSGFDIEIVNQAVARLLVEASHRGLHSYCCEMDARKALGDVGFNRILTKHDLPGLQDGFKLALGLPEYLGYVCLLGDQGKPATRWGAYLYDFRRTMTLVEDH